MSGLGKGATVLKHHRNPRLRRRRRATLLAAVAAVPLAVLAAQSASLDLGTLTEGAALLSAMVSMPEGSLSLLEQRFSDQLDRDYYGPQQEDAAEPYVRPWTNPENQSSPVPNAASRKEDLPQPASGERPPIQAPSPAADTDHPVEEAYRGEILQENMAGTAADLISYGYGKLRNYTQVPGSQVLEIMEEGMNIHLEDTTEPQVLIFHTHATESFEPYDSPDYDLRSSWRSIESDENMIAVGDALAKELADAGIGVIHDTTLHDYPSYNGSYERSAETIKGYLEQYPTIKVALDVHRDAIQREEDLIVKPVTEIDGKKAAQLMIITGSDDGTMNIPHWQENLRFAAQVQNAIETDWPHLTRPIFFCYRKYNMDLTTGSLLLEVGSQANTLEEAVYTAQLVGRSLARLLNENRQPAQDTLEEAPSGPEESSQPSSLPEEVSSGAQSMEESSSATPSSSSQAANSSQEASSEGDPSSSSAPGRSEPSTE